MGTMALIAYDVLARENFFFENLGNFRRYNFFQGGGGAGGAVFSGGGFRWHIQMARTFEIFELFCSHFLLESPYITYMRSVALVASRKIVEPIPSLGQLSECGFDMLN